MGNYSTVLLVVIFLIIALTLLVLFLTLLRETLFWYWRSKGVVQPPQDILNRPQETALIIRKNIDGLRKQEIKNNGNLHGNGNLPQRASREG